MFQWLKDRVALKKIDADVEKIKSLLSMEEGHLKQWELGGAVEFLEGHLDSLFRYGRVQAKKKALKLIGDLSDVLYGEEERAFSILQILMEKVRYSNDKENKRFKNEDLRVYTAEAVANLFRIAGKNRDVELSALDAALDLSGVFKGETKILGMVFDQLDKNLPAYAREALAQGGDGWSLFSLLQDAAVRTYRLDREQQSRFGEILGKHIEHLLKPDFLEKGGAKLLSMHFQNLRPFPGDAEAYVRRCHAYLTAEKKVDAAEEEGITALTRLSLHKHVLRIIKENRDMMPNAAEVVAMEEELKLLSLVPSLMQEDSFREAAEILTDDLREKNKKMKDVIGMVWSMPDGAGAVVEGKDGEPALVLIGPSDVRLDKTAVAKEILCHDPSGDFPSKPLREAFLKKTARLPDFLTAYSKT